MVPFVDSYSAESSNYKINDTPEDSYRPQIYSEGKNVFVVWTDDSPGNADIFFAKSTDSGKSFNDPINLSKNEGVSAFPRLAVSDNNIYVTWYDYSAGESDIFFAKSTDGGITFETINLSDNPGGSYNQWVLSSESRVFVVWNDDSHPPSFEIELREDIPFHRYLGNFEIELATSTDGGTTFKTINLSNSSGYSINPRITTFENNIYVVWNDDSDGSTDIFFSASNDKGDHFKSSINISHSQNESEDAGIVGIKNNVFIIWKERSEETTDIYFSKSNDYGNSFSEPINLSKSKERSAIARDNQIAVIGDKVFVVWYDDIPQGDVFLAYSNDKGNHFEAPINLSQSTGKVAYSQIRETSRGLEIIWNDNSSGNWEVFSLTSTNNGTSFGSPENLSQDEFDSRIFILGPQISASDSQVYVVWENKTSKTSNLVLNTKTFQQIPPGDLILHTDDNSVDVEVSLDKLIIEPKTDVKFFLKFLDPNSKQLLSDVNYSFKVINSSQITIFKKESQYSKDGLAEQVVFFPQKGAFTIIIEVRGLGSSLPLDTTFSGTALSFFTAVPEFPFSPALILVFVLSSTIILKRVVFGKIEIYPK